MTYIEFGNVAANAVLPAWEYWGYTDQATAINIGGNTSYALGLTFTMPFTGFMIIEARLELYTSTGGVQQIDATLTATHASPDSGPTSHHRTEDGTSSGFAQFNMPLWGKWNTVNSGTSVAVQAWIQNGLGAPTLQTVNASGSARVYRTA